MKTCRCFQRKAGTLSDSVDYHIKRPPLMFHLGFLFFFLSLLAAARRQGGRFTLSENEPEIQTDAVL